MRYIYIYIYIFLELSQYGDVFTAFKTIYQSMSHLMRKPIIDHPFILKCYQLLLYHLSGEPIHDEKEILNDIRAIWNVSILAHCSM
jgi:hypothetical protein